MYGFIWCLVVCHMEKSWNVRSLDLGRKWTDSRWTLFPKWGGAPSCCQTTRRRSPASLCYEEVRGYCSILGDEGRKESGGQSKASAQMVVQTATSGICSSSFFTPWSFLHSSKHTCVNLFFHLSRMLFHLSRASP